MPGYYNWLQQSPLDRSGKLQKWDGDEKKSIGLSADLAARKDDLQSPGTV